MLIIGERLLKAPISKKLQRVMLQEQFQLAKERLFCWIQKQDWNDIVIRSNIIIFLVSFGIVVRLVFAYSYRLQFPVIELDNIWNRTIEFYPNNRALEGFSDFNYYYVAWVKAWFKEDWYPYPDWHLAQNSNNPLYYYSYPPLFLYFLFSLWRPGKSALWIALPLIITDASCAGIIFLIIEKVCPKPKARITAILAGLAMSLSPINIIYDGVYCLNPGPVTFLTLIAVYFIIGEKWRQGFFWLAIATMTKQNALFFAYPFFMFMLGKKVRTQRIRRAVFESTMIVLYFLIVCLLCSLPWLLLTPLYYGAHLLFPGRLLTTAPTIVDARVYLPVQFSFALQELGVGGIFLKAVAIGVNSMFLMILSANIFAVLLLWRAFQEKNDLSELFTILTFYIITTHIFMPKGTFKFYSAYFTPFILLAAVLSFNEIRNKNLSRIGEFLMVGIFTLFGVWYLEINRYFAPLLLFLVCICLGCLSSGRKTFFLKQAKEQKMKALREKKRVSQG